VRARRRYDEIIGKGGAADFEAIFEDVKRRDDRDMNRADSPMKPAVDAHLLDTSEMSIEAAFQAAKSIIDAALSRNA
jgi:cytidylate kinase